MVDIKLIHYSDGIIIECVDDKNARAIVPIEYLNEQLRKNWIPAYRRSPLTVIMKRLSIDFNYKNLGKYKYTHFEDNKALYYNFHREVTD